MSNSLDKFVMIGKMFSIEQAIKEDDFARLAHILGITPELAEDMTYQEIIQSMTVRMHDLLAEVDKLTNE